MANFNDAYQKLVIKEGGYVADPDDAGGETYRGISRRYNLDWKGWDIVDMYKRRYSGNALKKKLDSDAVLQDLVSNRYKLKYWDIFELDDVPSQRVAYQMFDTNVNCGQRAAIMFAQRALGLRETGKWTLDLLNNLVKIK